MAYKGPFGFKNGWNTKASSWTLPPDSMSDAQNVVISYADLKKRNGNTLLNSSALASGAAVHGLTDWLLSGGSRFLVATAGTKIYDSNTLSSTFTDITGAATITSGQNNLHTFSSLNNILAICGGITPDTPLQWTGTGNVSSLAGSPPIGNLTVVANNFMFISGIAATPSRVFWSNVSDPNTWGVSNFVDFRAADGDRVTCLAEQNQNLVIFKNRSIGLLWTQTTSVSGTATLAPLNQVIVGTGAPGPLCWDKLPDGRIVFFSTNGHVYILTGGTQLEDISDPAEGSNIQPTLDAMNVSRFPFACVQVYPTKNQIWISLSSATVTTNDTIFVYDYQLQVWLSKFTNINANVMESSIDARTSPDYSIILVTGNYAGNVYEQDIGSTDATVSGGAIDGYGTISTVLGVDGTDFIPCSAVVPLEAQAQGALQFGYGFNGLTVVTNITNISETAGGALLDTTFVLDTSTLAGDSTLRKIVPIVSAGLTASMQMQFRNQNASQPFTVHPIYLSDEGLS